MSGIEFKIGLPPTSLLDRFEKAALRRMIDIGHRVTDRAATEAQGAMRSKMEAAGLGGLGKAIKAGSDLKKNRRFRADGGLAFRVSGWLYVKGGERTRGAIDSYTNPPSVTITPKRTGLLWFATDDIQRLVGRGRDRRRLEPRFWNQYGLDKKIGPLVRQTAKDGTELLVVFHAGVSLSGKAGSARSLTKRGRPRKGQVAKEMVVAFIGIPSTSRIARLDPKEIAKSYRGKMVRWAQELMRKGI